MMSTWSGALIQVELLQLGENVDFFSVITADVEAELAKLDTGGRRLLRPLSTDPVAL